MHAEGCDERRPQTEGERSLSGASLLDTLKASDIPAIANDASGRLVFWNRAAETLFRQSAATALPKRCYEAVPGRDVFGNRYCSKSCPVLGMARRQEPVRDFALLVRTPGMPREESLNVTILKLPGARPDRFLLVHLLHPARPDRSWRLPTSPRTVEPRGNGHGEAVALADGSMDRPGLTPRETEVLGWITAGLQNKEIAQELRISLATVRNHVHNILEKMEVHSKLEAVSLAFRHGWISPGSAGRGSPREPGWSRA